MMQRSDNDRSVYELAPRSPPRINRRLPSAVSSGTFPSGGSMTIHGRVLLPSSVVKNFVDRRGGASFAAPGGGEFNRPLLVFCHSATAALNSAGVISSMRRPAHSFGRSNGVVYSSLVVKLPEMSGAPHGV